MSPDSPDAFAAFVDSFGPKFGVLDADEQRPAGVRISDVRRRRGRLTDDIEAGYRELTLLERDGVLVWQTPEDMAAAGSGSLRRGGRRGLRRSFERARVLKEVSVPVLEPNEYLQSLRDTDLYLNRACDAGLRVVTRTDQGFSAVADGAKAAYSGRTLLLVHGTFSSADHLLGEFAATAGGAKFLSDALDRYKGQVLVFDHPTLSVSPFLNAIDVARRLAGTTGRLDVVAHSRGGLIVQWWLEVLGDTLAGAEIRAVLAGTPLAGTSLAAPNRIQPLLSVLSNIGMLVDQTLKVGSAANPFGLAALALLKFVGKRESRRWGIPPIDAIGSRPGTDAAVAVIPGLQGQSAVSNNFELARLRAASARANVRYFALAADFEPEKIGWKLWKVLSEFRDRATDAAADVIFPKENDLVVDTAHMATLGKDRPIEDVTPFLGQGTVHHCNYFRQPETLTSLRKWLEVP